MKNISMPIGLRVPDGGCTYASAAIIWDKPEDQDNISGYCVYINGRYAGEASSTCFAAYGLEAGREYAFSVRTRTYNGGLSEPCREIIVSIPKMGRVIDVTKPPYSADGSGAALNTASIQAAIDSCPKNGVVLIPEGEFLCGALFLHSNMALEINGTLRGTSDPEDYPVIESRFEGWELKSRSSLINAGSLTHKTDSNGSYIYNCENIKIYGKGTVCGGGADLADKSIDAAMKNDPSLSAENALRCRGRLINLSNCRKVNISGLTLKNPPCWTVHMIYCSGVTTHGVRFESSGIHNGDGWDPDSSENCTIFGCVFRTGDDCIAIKSGKNPEGCKINRPSKNIRVYDCEFTGGLGLAVGSEMSGGVDGVYIRGCIMKNTRYGLELKATDSRGGYIRNVHAEDCRFDRILAHKVDYNDDGEAATDQPVFSDMTFENIKVCGRRTFGKTELMRYPIELEGFDGEGHYIKNITFRCLTLGDDDDIKKAVRLKYCRGISFENVLLTDGTEPEYDIDKSCKDIRITEK